jgi:hypothetical protein
MKDGSTRGKVLNIAVLLVFLSPILLYWTYYLLINPSPDYQGIDPEYEYFLNSLAVFKHQPYAYVDHPGTPVEMIGSAILGATYPWLAARPEGFVSFHLDNPQLFLGLAYGFLILTHLACLLVFFRLAPGPGHVSQAVLGAALASMYFAIQPYAFSGSVLWSHNSFSFPFGTLLLLALYGSLMREASGRATPTAVWIGLGLGVGILTAITIFLASWAVGILITISLYFGLLKRRWMSAAGAALAFALSGIMGFYLAVLPVINKMGGFWNWIYGILSHQSSYLAVPKNQSAIERISGNVLNLWHLLPALFIAMVIVIGLAAAALLLFRNQIKEQDALWAMAGGLSAQIIALTLVFLDRPLRAYYFLGVAAIVPMLAMVVLKLYERIPSTHRILATGVCVAVLIGLIVNSFQAIVVRQTQSQAGADSQNLIQQVILERAHETNRSPDSLMILWMYGTYSKCWGLWFADHRAGDAFDREIAKICPNQYELAGRVLLPSGKAPLETTDWDIIFTCDRYTDEVLAKEPGAVVRQYPSIEWACGKMAAIFNP